MFISNKLTKISKWVSLNEKTVVLDKYRGPETFHSIQQADYVSVIAVDLQGRIPIVRQYRPALDTYTLELPGGLLDQHESPELSAERELLEETGYIPIKKIIPFPLLYPDTGRLENRLWGFFAEVTKTNQPDWRAEPGLEVLTVTPPSLKQMILDGEFNHALHLSLLGLALTNGYLTFK